MPGAAPRSGRFAGIASSSMSDSLSAAVMRAAAGSAPKAPRIGSLVAETIVLVNPARNYAQFANDGGMYDELLTYMRRQKLV